MTRAFLAAVSLLLAMQTFAWGQTSVQTTDVTRSAGTAQPAGRFAKFAGISVKLATYVGSGSFYVSGYRSPYASLALFAVRATTSERSTSWRCARASSPRRS